MPRYKETSLQFRQPNQPTNDECYTPIGPVYEELSKWAALGKFKDKNIICPCDTKESAFVKVLTENKEAWGVKSITYSHIDNNIDCLEIDYSQYDICITNPPFSLYKTYLPLLIEANIDLLMIAPKLARANKFEWQYLQAKQLYLGFGRDLCLPFTQPNNKTLRVCVDWITTWSEAQDEVNSKPFITVGKDNYEIAENIPEQPIICKPWKTMPPDYPGYVFCSLGVLDKLPQDKYEWQVIYDAKRTLHKGKIMFKGLLIKKKTRSKS